MGKLIHNAISSWVTSLAGTVVGLPMIWEGIGPMFDGDTATKPAWGLAITGLAAFIMGIVARDGNKTSEQVGAK